MLSKSDFNIKEALKLFNQCGVEVSFLVPTKVGLGKSILDATSPLRNYLRQTKLHNYEGQQQGVEGKKIVKSFFVTPENLIETKASLYRPFAKGKDGDPRIWFSKLPSYSSPNNLLAILVHDGSIYVINISNDQIRESLNDANSPIKFLLAQAKEKTDDVSSELLELLIDIAKTGWKKSVRPGDTGIGATLEELLGISINSSKQPDYKGIELKTKRIAQKLRAQNRSSLFAQVPDWSISTLKSSSEILDAYGYLRGEEKRLYCSVNSQTKNSQGLMLSVDDKHDLLHEVHSDEKTINNVVTWNFDTLRSRLLTKHNETFWIDAESKTVSGSEHFHYKKVTHTKMPFASNFYTLCDEGIITLDHLIKRNANGEVTEKGPLFKIRPNDLDLLFPTPQEIDLI